MHYTQVIKPLNSKLQFYKFAAYKLAPPLNKTKKASYKCRRNCKREQAPGVGRLRLGKVAA